MSIIHEALRKAEVEKERDRSSVLETFSIDHVLDFSNRSPNPEAPAGSRRSLKSILGLSGLFVLILLCYLVASFVYQAYVRRVSFQEDETSALKPLRQLYHEKLANPDVKKPVVSEVVLEKPKPMRQMYHERLVGGPQPLRNEKMFQLMGIVSDTDTRSALINGKLVGVGDDIEGASVKAVRENEVILEKQGRQFTISLH